MLNIVLHEPEIPQNTGNIARTCAVLGAGLHLIRPLGFSVSSKYLKRSGLDYWDKLDITYYDSIEDFFEKHPDCEFFCYSTKAPHIYTDVVYPEDTFFFFGKETKGLPESFLKANLERCVRIPMRNTLRSLNLSNSVAVAAYEFYRQRGFEGLQETSDYLIINRQN